MSAQTPVISEASSLGRAMQFIMEYAKERNSINLQMLREAYMLAACSDAPLTVALDRCVQAGYLSNTMLPGVYVSGFTRNGKLKSLSNFSCN